LTGGSSGVSSVITRLSGSLGGCGAFTDCFALGLATGDVRLSTSVELICSNLQIPAHEGNSSTSVELDRSFLRLPGGGWARGGWAGGG